MMTFLLKKHISNKIGKKIKNNNVPSDKYKSEILQKSDSRRSDWSWS
jgi:hypothetical protein